jgi:SAM-dependent methyltransferase
MRPQMPLPIPPSETRSRERLRRHYEIEKRLADRLRAAPQDQRRQLYGEVYDELFRGLPELPRLAQDPESLRFVVGLQAAALEPLVDDDSVFLELGAGDCSLALHLAGRVRKVYAVDASAAAAAVEDRPDNFELVLADATELALEPESVDVAYSCHFLEHLHPEDARAHLAAVLRVLRPGGRYLCVTPNRLWGPHDVSRYFADVPRGLHLREYTHGDLARLFLSAGYGAAKVLRGQAQPPRCAAVWPYAGLETALELLPLRLRRRLMDAVLDRRQAAPYRPLEQVQVVGFRRRPASRRAGG